MADKADVVTKADGPEQEDIAFANQSTPRLEPLREHRAFQYSESVLVHEQEWKRSQDQSFINGSLPTKTWRVNCADGTIVAQGTEWRPHKALDYFLTMFPTEHLSKIVSMTSAKLERDEQRETSAMICTG